MSDIKAHGHGTNCVQTVPYGILLYLLVLVDDRYEVQEVQQVMAYGTLTQATISALGAYLPEWWQYHGS
jgi:hypothetical protein